MSCDFSYGHYKYILKSIKEKNYEFIFFKDAGTNKKEIIIRHDIDLDINKALEMAKLESGLNVKSTYFIWLTSPFYNMFDIDSSNSIKEILDMGHEIGLHFDERCYNVNSEAELKCKIDNETSLIKNYFGIDIKNISFHMPSEGILDNKFQWDDIINTYHQDFFRGYKYLSDSEMKWREGCLCRNVLSNKFDKIQALIHPVWWNKTALRRNDAADIYYENRLNKVKKEWEQHIKV